MMTRFSFLAALALAASFTAGADAQSIASFGQVGNTGLISYVGAGGPPSVLTITRQITFNIVEAGLLDTPTANSTNATFILTADSMGGIAGAPPTQGGFFGNFSVVADDMDILLSGTFTGGSLSFLGGGNSSFVVDPLNGGDLSYTDSVFVPLISEGLNFVIIGSQTSGSNFTGGSVGGNFAGATEEFPGAIPEPATLAMAGLGIFALPLAVRTARRRRSVTSN